MHITLNGQPIDTEQTTVEGLLIEQGYTDCAVATAVNTDFVPAANRAEFQLSEGMSVEVVAPMQGG